jgi:long-subunit fatty acid transport protein
MQPTFQGLGLFQVAAQPGAPSLAFIGLEEGDRYFRDEVFVDLEVTESGIDDSLFIDGLAVDSFIPGRKTQRLSRRVSIREEGERAVLAELRDGGVSRACADVTIIREYTEIEQVGNKLSMAFAENTWGGANPELIGETSFVVDELENAIGDRKRFDILNRSVLVSVLGEQELIAALGDKTAREEIANRVRPVDIFLKGMLRRDNDGILDILLYAVNSETTLRLGQVEVSGRVETLEELTDLVSELNLRLEQLFPVVRGRVIKYRSRNVSLSLNYQRKFNFGKSFDVDYDTGRVFETGTLLNQLLDMKFTQKGGLGAISPAIAIELTKTLSIGAALNLWRSSPLAENDWEQTTRLGIESFFGTRLFNFAQTKREKFDDFEGENVTLGLLWNVTDRWNLAMRYDSAFTGTVDYELKTTGVRFNLHPSNFIPIVQTLGEQREIRFPDSLSIGAAYRRNDRLTVAMDITRTDWNDFYMKDGAGRKFSLVDASRIDIPGRRTHLKPTYSVRLGSEYVMIPKNPDERLDRLWSIRGGLFYEEEPATNKSSRSAKPGNGKPDRFYGFAAGLGLLVKQRVNIDFAYQFRYGHGVNKDFLRGPPGFEDDLFQHRFVLSSVVYFKTGR